MSSVQVHPFEAPQGSGDLSTLSTAAASAGDASARTEPERLSIIRANSGNIINVSPCAPNKQGALQPQLPGTAHVDSQGQGYTQHASGEMMTVQGMFMKPSVTYKNRRMSISVIPTPFAQANADSYGELEETWDVEHLVDDLPKKSGISASSLAASRGGKHTARISPSSRWRHAIKSVATMKGVANQFHTLRDMQSSVEVPRQAVKVVSVLGKGAFAIVEKCIYRPDGAKPITVAVKRLKPELTRNEADIKDMVQEIALLRKLANRHIVAFYGYGHWDFSINATQRQGSLFIVEELVDGGSLKTIVNKQMRDDQNRHYRSVDALRWLRQIAQGLAYLHRSEPQVIHRDLKLDNILIKGTNMSLCEAKIADFGLSAIVRNSSVGRQMAKEIHSATMKQPARARRASATDLDSVWMQAAAARQQVAKSGKIATAPVPHARRPSQGQRDEAVKSPSRRTSMTESMKLEVVVGYDQLSGRTGTLMYMAPEVYRQEKYNEKADVYSWSVIAYELLHRYTMISATDGSIEECQAYARRVARGFRPPITSKMPQPVALMLQMCWHQEPDQRPSMETIAKTLLKMEESVDFDTFDRAFLGNNVHPLHRPPDSATKSGSSSNRSSCCVIS